MDPWIANVMGDYALDDIKMVMDVAYKCVQP